MTSNLENLQSVGGDLSVVNSMISKFESLQNIGGILFAHSERENAENEFPNLKKVYDSFFLINVLVKEFPELEEIKGNFHCHTRSEKETKFTKLKKVGGNLYYTTEIEFPCLEEIGGLLSLSNETKEFPALKEVGNKVLGLEKYKKRIIAYNKKQKNYWEDYFIKTGRTELSEKVIETKMNLGGPPT
jgi:hypothetical protein